jgi:hypothetical protein
MSRAIRAVRATLVVSLAVLVVGACASCSNEPDKVEDPGPDASSFPLQSPTAEEVSAATGLVFPESMADYRSANSPSAPQLEIGFTMSAAEVESFASASGLRLSPDERILIHASPVWGEQNPAGDLRSGTVTKGRYVTKLEIRTNYSETEPDKAAVRILVTLR